MKITVGRLKTIINEEMAYAKKKYKRDEEEPEEDSEEEAEEAPPELEEPAHIQQLKGILEKWEDTEYDSDEERWQAYAEDIQDLVDGDEPKGHSEEECEEVHPEQSHEEWEEGEEDNDPAEKEDKPKEKKEEGATPKKTSKSSGKNFPYESKKLEQMVYQKLLTAFGDK
jgi:hypothetical protein